MVQINKISRRKFLGQASCAAIGSTTLFSTLFNLKTLGAATSLNSSIAGGGDYKALVCLFNAGGMDSYNMLMPRNGASYSEYAKTRSNVAIAKDDMLPISPITSDGREYGLHPSLPQMQQLFENNKLAFISNIGTLVHPLTKQQFYNGSLEIPLGLYSHSDQAKHWQTGIPNKRVGQGWGGKVADMLNATYADQKVSMNYTLSGSNLFQTGNTSVEYALDSRQGSIGIYDYHNDWILSRLKKSAIDQMVNPGYENVFKKTYVNTIKQSIDGNEILTSAIDAAPAFNVPFVSLDASNKLSESLEMVAKVISGRDILNASRQIFFIEYGGWDHHDELLSNQAEMLKLMDDALYQFNAAMDQLGLTDQVTTFSVSEFSRTLTSNGNGTDHAWGGNAFVMGGAVKGRNMFGQYPSLLLGNDNPLEIGGGSLIPTTATDLYFAELAMWFGVPASDISTLFPNIGNFYDITSGTSPIGFL